MIDVSWFLLKDSATIYITTCIDHHCGGSISVEYKRSLTKCAPFGALGRFKMGCLLDDGLQATWTKVGLDISMHFRSV